MDDRPGLRKGVSIVTFGVKNLEQSIKFYQDLGW